MVRHLQILDHFDPFALGLGFFLRLTGLEAQWRFCMNRCGKHPENSLVSNRESDQFLKFLWVQLTQLAMLVFIVFLVGDLVCCFSGLHWRARSYQRYGFASHSPTSNIRYLPKVVNYLSHLITIHPHWLVGRPQLLWFYDSIVNSFPVGEGNVCMIESCWTLAIEHPRFPISRRFFNGNGWMLHTPSEYKDG